MADRYGVKLAAGAEVFEWQGRACYKYNSKIKVAGDSVKVVFYEDGIMCGYPKNGKELAGSFEEPTRAKPVYDDEARLQRFIRTNKNAKARLHDYVKANLHKHKDNNGKKQSFKFMTLTFREDIRDLSVANKAFNAFKLFSDLFNEKNKENTKSNQEEMNKMKDAYGKLVDSIIYITDIIISGFNIIFFKQLKLKTKITKVFRAFIVCHHY